jgi:hypothetical protein
MQTDAAELYLGSNCVLKVSFQGHEKESSNKTINHATVNPRTRTVVNMQQIPPGLTTYCRARAGTNSFDCYNIRPWMP